MIRKMWYIHFLTTYEVERKVFFFFSAWGVLSKTIVLDFQLLALGYQQGNIGRI